jgi:hypothetical protein
MESSAVKLPKERVILSLTAITRSAGLANTENKVNLAEMKAASVWEDCVVIIARQDMTMIISAEAARRVILVANQIKK